MPIQNALCGSDGWMGDAITIIPIVSGNTTVTISMTVTPAVDIGNPVIYRVTLTNNGVSDSDNTTFFDQTPNFFQYSGFPTWAYTGGASGGATIGFSTFAVSTMPAFSTATAIFDGIYAQGFQAVTNTATGLVAFSNPNASFFGTGDASITTCAIDWEEWHVTVGVVCRTLWRKNCDGLLYENDRVQLYVGADMPVIGSC